MDPESLVKLHNKNCFGPQYYYQRFASIISLCITNQNGYRSLFSIIIPMYNEAPSMLLRMVHSVLQRTPPELLAEVIIVDDISTNENMKQVLTDYVQQLPKVCYKKIV